MQAPPTPPPAAAPIPPPPVSGGPPRQRTWLPPAAVLAVIVAVVFGGYFVAGALSLPAGRPVDVGSNVRVHPLSGWERAASSNDPPFVALDRGGGNLFVLAVGTQSDALTLIGRYLAVLASHADRLSTSGQARPVVLQGGLMGLRAFYIGVIGARGPSAIEGEVTAVVSPTGVGVIFDGWAPKGLLQFVREDIETMIETAKVR